MAEVRLVKDFKKYSYSFVFGAAVTSVAAAINPDLGIKGEVAKIVVSLPDWTNTVSAVVTMDNADALEIFESATLAQNEDYDITLIANECIIMGATGEQWVITLSGVPGGAGGTATLTAYVA